MSDDFLTIPQLAARLRVCPRIIRRSVEAGTIPHRQLGQTVVFRWRDIDAWCAEWASQLAGEDEP